MTKEDNEPSGIEAFLIACVTFFLVWFFWVGGLLYLCIRELFSIISNSAKWVARNVNKIYKWIRG